MGRVGEEGTPPIQPKLDVPVAIRHEPPHMSRWPAYLEAY